FEAGERHGLPRISILNYEALLDPEGLKEAEVDPGLLPKLAELPVAKARAVVIEELEARELLVNVEDHQMALGKCYRCKTVVEPYLSPQWFVKIQPLADPAIAAVTDGRIRIIPEGWTNNYLGWMRDIKDWCISRQIWWGHRIPAWYCLTCHPEVEQASQAGGSGLIPIELRPLVGQTAPPTCPACGGTSFFQDPDVLDTWFSSALWPFSTFGWPEKTPDLQTFYPTSTLVTGLDILFFWVARMIMMGLKFTGDVPFRDVYIHALVRDAEGQKMSKSKGNVIDPLTKMSQYGTDALRFTLASMASPGRDIKLAEERIEGYRNFTNKIWNAARFLLLYADGPRQALPIQDRTFPDQWILSRLQDTIESVTTHLENYRFDHAANQLYHFIWHEYCDWYLELIKPVLQSGDTPEAQCTRHTMLETFEILVRTLHPFMPFLTEEIWQSLPHEGDTIVLAPYPAGNTAWTNARAEQDFAVVEQFVTTTRTGRSLLEYLPSHTLTLYGTSKDPSERDHLQRLRRHIEHLSRSTLTLSEPDTWPAKQVLHLVSGSITIGLMIEGEVDLKKSLQRIKKQLGSKQKEATRLQGRLSSPDFSAKASPEVIQESQDRLHNLKLELSLLSSSEQQLQQLI
ncbi:MAG: class I tRNA ligase family protein, partial [Nitrospirota bacterium]|nr:class I tRNA ligase family protein [Nitrospirota bacterium]